MRLVQFQLRLTTIFLAFSVLTGTGGDSPCIPRNYGLGSIVCVCNATYCDSSSKLSIPSYAQLPKGFPLVQILTSTKNGLRLHKSSSRFETGGDPKKRIYGKDVGKRSVRNFLGRIWRLRRRKDEAEVRVRVQPYERFQRILGLGGSFTDAAGENIRKLSPPAQENLMKSYFGPDGAQYSLARVPIGGTDFSSRPYTYDDNPTSIPDTNLTSFALQPEDLILKIPLIHWANKLRREKLRLVASPWSAPVWMKTNRKLSGAGLLRREYFQLWADYYVKFIESYEEKGIFIWGVTTGNEPLNGLVPGFPFNCMGWSPTDARKWIEENLGPTLVRRFSQRSDEIQVIMMDDNKVLLPLWASAVLGPNKTSSSFVHGVGTHWYLDFLVSSDALSRFHEDYPDKFILQTEACLGFVPWETQKVLLGSWERAETYLEAIINDMRNWVGGWIDWNLALDLNGGPNWAGWKADAAILVDPSKDEFLKQPIYYGISHVSKFVPPGSVRIGLMTENIGSESSSIKCIAFKRPDNGTVIVLLNKSSVSVKISVQDERRGQLRLKIPGKGMQTVIYW